MPLPRQDLGALGDGYADDGEGGEGGEGGGMVVELNEEDVQKIERLQVGLLCMRGAIPRCYKVFQSHHSPVVGLYAPTNDAHPIAGTRV